MPRSYFFISRSFLFDIQTFRKWSSAKIWVKAVNKLLRMGGVWKIGTRCSDANFFVYRTNCHAVYARLVSHSTHLYNKHFIEGKERK